MALLTSGSGLLAILTSPTFVPHQVGTTDVIPDDVPTADVDGDGDADVLAVGGDASGHRILWFENTGPGAFAKHTISASEDHDVQTIHPEDLDGDGDVDLVVGFFVDKAEDEVRWYENDGTESFTEHVIDASAAIPFEVTTADLDGDGDADVVSANAWDDEVAWYENDGTGDFTEQTAGTLEEANAVEAADIDEDGDVDLLASARNFGDDLVAWYENRGSGSFTEHVVDESISNPNSVAISDVDLDGNTDLVASARLDNAVYVYFNDGAESFTRAELPHGLKPLFVTTADVDDDGLKDVLASSRRADTIAWWENLGGREFQRHNVSQDADQVRGIGVADLDGDEDLDVTAATRNPEKVNWYEQQPGLPLLDELPVSGTSGSTSAPFAQR